MESSAAIGLGVLVMVVVVERLWEVSDGSGGFGSFRSGKCVDIGGSPV